MTSPRDIVPVAEAAIQLRLSREQLIRRIQVGAIAGGKALGWFVYRDALDKAIEEQATAITQTA